MAKIVVPTANTTITSAWGKSVADAINLIPFVFAAKVDITTDLNGFFTITFPAGPLPFTPTWGILQKHGNNIVAQNTNLTILGLTATALSCQAYDFGHPAAGIGGQIIGVSYIVGATRA